MQHGTHRRVLLKGQVAVPHVGARPFIRIEGQDLGVTVDAGLDRMGFGGLTEEPGQGRERACIEGLVTEEQHFVKQERLPYGGDLARIEIGGQGDVGHLCPQHRREGDHVNIGHDREDRRLDRRSQPVHRCRRRPGSRPAPDVCP